MCKDTHWPGLGGRVHMEGEDSEEVIGKAVEEAAARPIGEAEARGGSTAGEEIRLGENLLAKSQPWECP